MTGLSLVLAGAAAGIIVFFGAIVAPTVFGTLGEEKAGPIVRKVFPKYYLALGLLSGIAFLIALWNLSAVALLYGLTFAGFIYARQFLMPEINAARDASLAGNSDQKATFDRLHKLSVQINFAQLGALLVGIAITLLV